MLPLLLRMAQCGQFLVGLLYIGPPGVAAEVPLKTVLHSAGAAGAADVPAGSLYTTLVWSKQKLLVPEDPGPTGVADTV